MHIPVRLNPQHPARKVIAAVLIAAIATGVAYALRVLPGFSIAGAALDNTLYDAFYHLRKYGDRKDQPIVIVTSDEETVANLATKRIRWPYPRILWGNAIKYLQQCGAKAVVFDIIFQEPSGFDQEFGKMLDEARIPVVIGSMVDEHGKPAPFAPKVSKPPLLGAVNILNDKVIREYKPAVGGTPSLAIRGAEAAGVKIPAWAQKPFRLHYYGPTNLHAAGSSSSPNAPVDHTYRYVHAWSVFTAAQTPARAAEVHAEPQLFRGKIVIIGATAAGQYDLKSSPLDSVYPGVEAQATAIDNLMSDQVVEPLSGLEGSACAIIASLLAAFGVIAPRRVLLKVVMAIVAAGLLVAAAIAGFVAYNIHWLPMAAPLVALLLATVGAFAFTYFVEDRQRRLVLKALTQYVSPEVAAEIEQNPDSLKLGGQRREMTVMFTDIQGFTDLSETMESEKLSELLNFYLGEMSALILANNGTLDKYIGDAIMSFWNAPVLQPDHSALACKAALAMRDREAEIQDQLRAMGAPNLLTRIGINTGPMVFGNMGSPQKFNYSVLGDSVNLGSRLEGANKFYGSRILVAETTAASLRDRFLFRQLDMLRVKGKQKPLAVFELLAEGQGEEFVRWRANQYELAFEMYRAQKWDEAESILALILRRDPNDGPASVLLKRVTTLRVDHPPADWDGVYVAKEK